MKKSRTKQGSKPETKKQDGVAACDLMQDRHKTHCDQKCALLSYEPLWRTMKRRDISTYVLIKTHKINPRTIYNLKHNKSITMYTLENLCSILDCSPNDIVEFVPEPGKKAE